MTIRNILRVAAPCIFAGLLAACGGGGHFTPGTTPADAPPPDQQNNTTIGAPIQTMSLTKPASTSFLPSSWGKIGTFQIFDETNNGYITASAASQHGWRYSAVWGVRPGLGAAWRMSNSGLKSSYYFIAITDPSTTAWGAIGHSLSWWQTYHPSWVLYACSVSTNAPTHYPAYVSTLKNVPLDFHNLSTVNYQIPLVAKYAGSHGYTALAADEVTFWPAMSVSSGYYPCGIWSGSTFVRRYKSRSDPAYITDMINWAKQTRYVLRNNTSVSGYHLKLIVNHPGTGTNTYEQMLFANVDAMMDETGFTAYGKYRTSTTGPFLNKVAWMRYGQSHGVAMLINQDWGWTTIGPAQRDYSLATYLMGNEQSAAAFISAHTGYGIEVWRSEYAYSTGAPCAEYYGGLSYSSTSPSVYYRRFANALVVVNAGGSTTQYARLPTNHTYSDLEGRTVRNPLPLAPNDGYVLKDTYGCT